VLKFGVSNRKEGHDGWGWGPKSSAWPWAKDLPAFCENSKVWAFTNFRLTLELGRSHIKAEFREFVEGNK
jgi:hypothetical protein